MSPRKAKQIVKGFLNSAGKLVHPRNKDTLFLESSSSGSRRTALLRHMQP
jgi:hypothetical protein